MKFFISILFLVSGTAIADPVDWAERAREASWSWPRREPSLFLSTMQDKERYQVLLEHIWSEKFLIHITRNNQARLKFEGHVNTVFVFRGDEIFYARFNPSTSGCTIVAFDLAAGKQLWEKRLKGIGPIEHSHYSNQVSLHLQRTALEVYGWEEGGKYLEYLDIETGETVAHRLFEKGF